MNFIDFKRNPTRLVSHTLAGILILSSLLNPSLAMAEQSTDYIPDNSVLIFLFKVNKNDPGVAALNGKALEKLSKGKIPQQAGQNILSLASGEALIVAFSSNSNQETNKLEYGIVSGYVRENFDFTLSFRGNPVRMKAKSIPNLESKVLSPLIEQALHPEGKNFTREKFKESQIVYLDKTNGNPDHITAYSFAHGKILFGSTASAVKALLLSYDKKSQNSYSFYEPFIKGADDGILILDNTKGQLAELVKNNKDLGEVGTILSLTGIQKATVSFNLVDENSLTGNLDIHLGKEGNLGLLKKELELLGVFMKGRLFLDGLKWSNKVQKQGESVQMEFKIKNLKNYLE